MSVWVKKVRDDRNLHYQRATTQAHGFLEQGDFMNGARLVAMVCLLLCCTILAIIPCVTAAESLTRGSMFTVSIAGRPATPYYVWFTRTSAMSGEPGDQPPVIVANTERVEFDPDGGPYVIGSYRFNNGNGRTILDDVAPSSATSSNTRYYAKVTTDADGFAIIQFTTSPATAQRTFSIRAENPAAPGESVPVHLGLPQRETPVAAVTMTPAGSATTRPAITLPLPTPSPPETTESPPLSPIIPVTVPATTRQAPADAITIVLAACTGLLVVRSRT